MSMARVLARTTIGGLFVGHGLQKLFGWFGGGGIDGTADMFEHLGLHPARRNAVAAGVSETAGGAQLFAGLATPLAAATLTATMLTAIRRVHLPRGPWNSNGGYEYNLVLIAAVLAIAEEGPGRPSLDAALGIERRGTRWAVAAGAGGALGALAVHRLAEREAATSLREQAEHAGAAAEPLAPTPAPQSAQEESAAADERASAPAQPAG